MVWKEQVCSNDLGPVCFKTGGCISGVCNLLDEMSTSDFRSPSRVLEVTVHQAYYPITEKVLHLLFDPFGEVQHVHVLGRSNHVLAVVVFQSKHQAAEAFEELHGRNIYDRCCQMEIKWGFSQETVVSVVTNKGETAASSPCTQFPSATAAMSTLDDFNSEKRPVEAAASGEHTMSTTTASIGISVPSKPSVALHPGDGNTATSSSSALLHALSVLTIGEEVITDVHVVVAALQASDIVLGDVVDNVSANCLTKCEGNTTASLPAMQFPSATTTLPVIDKLGFKKLPVETNAIGEHNEATAFMAAAGAIIFAVPLVTVSDVVDRDVDNELLVLKVVTIAKEAVIGPKFIVVDSSTISKFGMAPVSSSTRPPPTELEPNNEDAELRPSPWPSFNLEILMVLAMSMRCANFTVAVRFIPEANRIYIQHSEGVMVFFDQGCIVKSELFASLEGKDSVQFCLYGMRLKLWNIVVAQGDQKVSHLISFRQHNLYFCSEKLLQASTAIWCYVLNFISYCGTIPSQKQKRFGEMLMPWHIHAQVPLPSYLLVEWELKSMIAKHSGSSIEISQPSEQFQETSRLLSKCSRLDESYRVLSPFRSIIELLLLDRDNHEMEFAWHCNLLSIYLRLGSMFYYKKYSFAIQKFSEGQFSVLTFLVCKFSLQELATHTGRHILPMQILEAAIGSQHVVPVSGNRLVASIAYSTEGLQVTVSKEGVGLVWKKILDSIHNKISRLKVATIECGMISFLLLLVAKNLHVTWDPGGMVISMKVSLNWLEGKPKLKEEGMLGPTGILEWAVAHQQVKAQAEHQDTTKGSESGGEGIDDYSETPPDYLILLFFFYIWFSLFLFEIPDVPLISLQL